MAETLYTRDILRLATSIPYEDRLEKADGRAKKRAPICGSHIDFDICIDRDEKITAVGMDVSACALGQASAALLGQHIIGRSLDEIKTARQALADFLAGIRPDSGTWPGLMIFEPARPHTGRHGAICLPFDAAIAAFETAIASKMEIEKLESL
ncbi:iron-sulfur cluster assembly scaffold protein [Zymomonas mobilis]|uniref:Nitrogen-fixing NifU domain protein n=1 Tax=Zymomonas mobilis subsp. pomaceae (strain ATCC 29192 / DSM 22645 / JCM 10191 / CCUG 17912 / NBRC 13757 / NCIMB 11200 / NRRL B-4491 / Barker I) TaxID=579138 RepID=F8ERS2_ZYMMT|nr:iron-sulfur cluster assembly scaffold protein [Zymomonas mobilis]AEI37530.1 nitrogen-fixing NifU domain protein [Zymomonas mobilis subsp. pomaceae ATCC 29192]MDX5948898.1 iron-sulfur cluster assembly scaffold protein [Zymomonas mobilis subsp. pomaceae]GEB88704.1 iron-sulfur cluster scaffold-like protein [Zymomonas mobilis subsp. pomaceae]